jgi:hypothetical protein
MGVTWLAADSNSLPCTIDRIYLSTLYMVGLFLLGNMVGFQVTATPASTEHYYIVIAP